MFVTNWISTTKIQKISEITNFFRHYFLSRTEVIYDTSSFFYLFSIFLHRITRSYRKSIPAVPITHGFYTESGLTAIG